MYKIMLHVWEMDNVLIITLTRTVEANNEVEALSKVFKELPQKIKEHSYNVNEFRIKIASCEIIEKENDEWTLSVSH